MKIKLLILTMLVFFFGTMDAKATVLPKEVKDYLVSQKKVPTVRFDGVVVYNEDIMYLPIFPAYATEVDSLKIVKTYPENKTMNDLPDMVLFNNNMSLLKVIRTGNDTLSVRNIPEIPVEIKTGILPQDIMVPRGFVLPDSYAGILGNVEIPLIGSAKTSTFITTKKSAPLPNGKHVIKTKNSEIPVALKNKLFYVNNFQTEFLQVYSSEVSEPLYSLKTSGVMKDVKPVLDGKFLLVATRNQKNIDVIDVQNEYIVKHHIARFLGADVIDRSEPFYFYFLTLLWGFFPWVISCTSVWIYSLIKNVQLFKTIVEEKFIICNIIIQIPFFFTTTTEPSIIKVFQC